MTQPIQEPSHDRAMQGANWGVRQLFRRPAQSSGGTGDFIRLFSWNYWTSNTIPTSTWRYVANSTNESFYEEDVASGMEGAGDCSTGIISLADQAEYLITGWVQWNEDPEDGETRITALNFGASDRLIEMYHFDAAMGSIAQLKLPVTGGKIVGVPSTGVALEVWHNNSGSISIRDAEIAVYRIRIVTDADFEFCAT